VRPFIGVIVGLLLVSPAFAQEEEEEPPPGKTFDVFDDETEEETDDLPEGDAPEEEEEPAPEPVEPPVEPPEAPPVEPPPPEEAAPPPPPPLGDRILVLLVGENEEATNAQRIGDQATRALAERRQLEAMSAFGALDPTAEETKREEIELGKKAIEEGLLAFEELDLATAGEKLETGVNALTAYYGELPDQQAKRAESVANVDGSEGFARAGPVDPARIALSEGIFAHAATTLFEGLTDQADSIFVALAVFDPSFVPEEGRYPSNVLDRFAGVKESLGARPTGSLTVKTNPPGAAVYVDGLFRGSSPATVSNLADGYHVVSVRRLGFRPLGTMTPVNAESSSTVDLELELSKDVSRLNLLSRDMFRDTRAAGELARALGAKEIAVLDFARRLSGTVVEGVLVTSEGTLIAKLVSTPVVEDPEIAGRTIAEGFVRAEQERIALLHAPPPETETAFYEEWWFWAAVGGAAVVVATSVAVGVTASADRPPNNTAIFRF
jgi:hypothetical protein